MSSAKPNSVQTSTTPLNRNDKVLCSIDQTMRILELGPLTTPIAPKSDGWLTTVVDHASREQLLDKYRADPNVDTSAIVDVDIVWSHGTLDAAVPRELHGTFDAFIASHVFEHIPDPIGLLRSLEQVLRPTSVVSLVIPDKRFCFDFFRPLSTVGGLLEAHARQAVRHSQSAVFDQVAYGIRADGEIAFTHRRLGDIEFADSLEHAKVVSDTHAVAEEAPYVDVHGWVFTPSSFALAMLELSALNAIDFTIVRSFASEGFEFCVTLRRGRVDHSDTNVFYARRLKLQRRILEELREQVEMLSEFPERNAVGSQQMRGTPLGPAASELPNAPTAMSATPEPTDDRSLAARVIAAYRFSAAEYESSESFWDTSFADLKADIHLALISRDLPRVQDVLRDPGSTDLFYGFDNLAHSLFPYKSYVLTPDDQNGTVIFRDLLMLCEAIGLRPLWNPENPAEATVQDFETLLAELVSSFGFTITFPNPFAGEIGLATSRGIASYRAIQALYQTWRIATLVRRLPTARVLEIGAGMGRTALYLCEFGISDYTIIDLPMTNVAQAAFLGRAMGEDQIGLAGENRTAKVSILPPSAFLEASDRYDLILNVDSMTELAPETASKYCRAIRDRARMFLSINHETYPQTVAKLAASVGMPPASRTPYWLRPGYAEEVFLLEP